MRGKVGVQRIMNSDNGVGTLGDERAREGRLTDGVDVVYVEQRKRERESVSEWMDGGRRRRRGKTDQA